MEFTDTHTHLYDRAFEQDIDQVVARALEAGVRRMFLPNEDSASLPALKALEARYPEYFRSMVGVHPTSITADNLAHELAFVEQQLAQGGYIGIGEIGMDLYWDTTYRDAQQEAFAARLRDNLARIREEIAAAGEEKNVNQYFAVLTNTRSVGVMGDGRTYDYTLALRGVTTSDFMTADWARIPYDVLDKVSTRIVNEVKGINRIVYDITSKPPATIEWE